jgi:hypothetical protein
MLSWCGAVAQANKQNFTFTLQPHKNVIQNQMLSWQVFISDLLHHTVGCLWIP